MLGRNLIVKILVWKLYRNMDVGSQEHIEKVAMLNLILECWNGLKNG